MKTTVSLILSMNLLAGCLATPHLLADVEPEFNANGITIDASFPGGNIALTETNGEDTFGMAPDQRSSNIPWFYWAFRVQGAAGKTLTFKFEPRHVGVAGPGVSLDGGLSWKWLGDKAVENGAFKYTFPEGVGEVRFSVGMPYQQSDLNRFLEKHKGNSLLQVGTLTTTIKGREVPLLKIGQPGKRARWAVNINARHHSCEMMASYAVEGMIKTVLADNETGKWLRENVDFFIVPFVDFDGVEDGDQGKNRAPHDHNRDYGDSPIYPEVSAIKEQLPVWSDNRPLVAMDIHDPALRSEIHETIHFLAPKEEGMAARLAAFTSILGRESQGLILINQPFVMKFGTFYNKLDSTPPTNFAGWVRTLPNTYLGYTLEIPYANASDSEVNAESARELGADLAYALKVWLEQQPQKF